MENLGVFTVGAIVVLCFLIGLGIKATPLDNRWIPFLCGIAGLLLGLLSFYLGMPDFPASDPVTAAAVGTASGLAATGAHQIGKQMQKGSRYD